MNLKRTFWRIGITPAAVAILVHAMMFAVCSVHADAIVLKNGRRLNGYNAVEEGDKVSIDGLAGHISVSKSSVERIEKGDAPPTTAREQSGALEQPKAKSAEVITKVLSVGVQLPQKDSGGIVKNGVVDETRLSVLAADADKGPVERATAIVAHLFAADFEARRQRIGPASRWAEEALLIAPKDMNALLFSAQLDIVREQPTEALRHLQLAESIAPESPDVLTMLGFANYFADGPEKANRYWKRAYALRRDPRLSELIRQTEKEEAVEGTLMQQQSVHFAVSWVGSEISPAFGREIVDTLEKHYRDLEADLDFSPREPLTVIFYTAQQFADITQTAGWVGALNDGKIRVPVQGLSNMTPALSHVLKHEMVHSFVHRQVQGRVPTWLNEGLAQVESGESPAIALTDLAKFFADKKQIPFSRLEGSFMELNAALARVAYSESYAAVRLIRDQYGAYQIPQILRALGEGKTVSEALRQQLRIDYSDLESDLASYLASR